MIHPTEPLNKLTRSIADARVIARGVPPDNSVTVLQHLKVQALVMFAHSAFEEYLETIGWTVAQEALRLHAAEAKITRALISLISSKLLGDISATGKRKITADLINNLTVFSQEAVNRFRAVIDNNNGIKERDQKNLLFPIGVDPETVDIVLMNNLNAFGATRGSIAHIFTAIRN